MAEWMADVFIELVNRSIAASWLVLAVLVLRLLLRRGPKWASVLLWGLVGFRLVCPFTLESALSLLPSGETVPENIMLSPAPALNSGVAAVDRVVNPIVAETFAPAPAASAAPCRCSFPCWRWYGRRAFWSSAYTPLSAGCGCAAGWPRPCLCGTTFLKAGRCPPPLCSG